uniref:Uncharacterized protein n=1 Tax=Arundo donax TaxID=35708 RepID=A0A0A9E8F8_ARUDO
MTSCEKIHLRVSSKNPEAVMLPPECLDTSSLCGIPDADALVFGVGHNDVLLCVEHYTRHIIHVASQGINLPRFRVVHSPQFHLTVISPRNNKW